MRLCSVDGCNKKHLAKGLCLAHYLRVRKHGTLDKLTMRGEPLIDRIMAKVKIEVDCWIFTGKLSGNNNYGGIRDGKKMRLAHVVMYECKYGLVPSYLELDHICKNPKCCNPDHLEAVTHQENVRRGRAGHNWHIRKRNFLGQWTKN